MKLKLKLRLIIALYFLIFFATKSNAQRLDNLLVLPGPKHTIVWVQSENIGKPDAGVIWQVNRADGGDGNFKEVGKISFPASSSQLQSNLGPKHSASVLEQLRADNMESAYKILKEHGVDTLGLLFIETQIMQAVGLAFIDESRNPLVQSVYRLDLIKGGKVQQSLTQKVDGKLPVYTERFRAEKYNASDSIVAASWRGMYPKSEIGVFFVNIIKKQNKEKDYHLVDRKLLSMTGETNESHVSFYEDAHAGSFLSYYIQLEDLAGNLGEPSDTIHLLAVDDKKLPVIKNFLATDTLGGLLLTWEPLPKNALFTGIQILKSRQSETDFIVVDTIASDLSFYLDDKVMAASTYYYKIRPLLFQLPSGNPYPFADAVGFKESRMGSQNPNTPIGVSARTTPSGIEVSWQRSSEPDIFGYMVLRGTSSKNLEVIEPSVKDYVYVDTTFYKGYSGQYHYAVQAIGMNQLLSDTSEIASVGVVQAIVLSPPGGISGRRIAEGVSLQWEDVRQKDDKVNGFMLYRRKSGTKEYRNLTSEALLRPYYIDTTAVQSEAYDYAVAASDAWGNQSVLSPNATINTDDSAVLQPPLQLNIRSLQAGIDLSWPQDYLNVEGKSFVVYRREVGKSDFVKLEEINNGKYSFLDNNVSANILYEYAVSVKYKNSEGLKSTPVSVRR